MEQQENIFRLGDKVYWMKYDYSELYNGTITDYPNEYGRGYGILESKEENTHFVGEDSISFTKWSRENGGFSQVRPKELPKVGDKVYAWDDASYNHPNDNACIYGVVQDILPNSKIVINNGHFSNYSFEPPF